MPRQTRPAIYMQLHLWTWQNEYGNTVLTSDSFMPIPRRACAASAWPPQVQTQFSNFGRCSVSRRNATFTLPMASSSCCSETTPKIMANIAEAVDATLDTMPRLARELPPTQFRCKGSLGQRSSRLLQWSGFAHATKAPTRLHSSVTNSHLELVVVAFTSFTQQGFTHATRVSSAAIMRSTQHL